ncbi:MAG: tRNA (adenosine(37)-N6)-dimethylallyltransferase MiaA [Pirellulaceae bacterium]
MDRCWILAGPTASGKSAIALALAERLNAEIISLDSMAVYREMDVGTAKPSAADQARLPHHLIDLVDPNEEFSVACYLQRAHEIVDRLTSAGRTPLFVGGTPMYLKAIIRGFDAGPPADWEFRRQVEEDVRRCGAEALRQRLRQVDPLSAHRLHPNDVRRMTRALEVARLTGVPLSHRQVQFEQRLAARDCRVFVTDWPREVLHQRINRRVEQMFAAGLVDETRRLLETYRQLSRTAAQAVGYGEVIRHLREGVPLSETRDAVQAHTRQLARRQETWLRSFGEIRKIPMREDVHPAEIAARIAEAGALSPR